MKKSISFIFFLAFLGTAVMGQKNQEIGFKITPEKIAERETYRMVQQLKLSKAQTIKVDAVNLKYAKLITTAFEAEDRSQTKEKVKQLRAEKAEELKNILTDEQYRGYEDMQGPPKARAKKATRMEMKTKKPIGN